MTDREIELEVALFSERSRAAALQAELEVALKRIFELEYPQMGIRRAESPKLKVVGAKE